jgi:hypothetical protein
LTVPTSWIASDTAAITLAAPLRPSILVSQIVEIGPCARVDNSVVFDVTDCREQ